MNLEFVCFFVAFEASEAAKFKDGQLAYLDILYLVQFTHNVTDMSGMFSCCHALRSIDVTSFNTSKVTNMGSMFSSCDVLTSLDLSNFDTSNVTDMSHMFDSCKYLNVIYAGKNWNTDKVTTSNNMFTACKNLKGAISFDRSKTDATYANWTTGYLTYKASTLNIKLDVDSNGSVNGYTEKAA